MRYFFELGYNGTNYNGWQSQPNGIGVQSVVENALSQLLRETITIVASGRTDTGVHCEQQFFHTDIATPFESQNLLQKLNSFLPKDIVIYSINPARKDAHARYDAIERAYQYRITLVKNPFSEGLEWHFFKPLNIQTMNAAASLLLGAHDFECFSKVKTDVNHFLCNIYKAEWKIEGQRLLFDISANRFLRGMVRAIVGTLVDVGTGKTSIDDFENIVHSRNRRNAGANVPPHGLYLVHVKYPDGIFEVANTTINTSLAQQ